MKYLIALSLLLASCNDTPFINHALKAEKAGACSTTSGDIKMVSNITGERYEFEYCLDENFDVKNYSIVRKGDSIVVSFPKSKSKTVSYKLYLDVDAKPAYHYITLGNQTIAIVHSDKF